MATRTQSIKLDTDTQERLKTLGQIRDRSPHYLMKAAIEEYLTREETYEREKREDQERWDEYLLTGVSVEHERVVEWLNALARGEDAECPQ